jgi:hypothetical protein
LRDPNLAPGHWRELTGAEVQALAKSAGRSKADTRQ